MSYPRMRGWEDKLGAGALNHDSIGQLKTSTALVQPGLCKVKSN